VTTSSAGAPTGADALLGSLLAGGVDVCFTNPGTSEMHVVAALDRAPGMRAVLTLFEGVATGAADGYARMADRPAATGEDCTVARVNRSSSGLTSRRSSSGWSGWLP